MKIDTESRAVLNSVFFKVRLKERKISMYKILVFGMTPNRGGIESVVVNFFRYMDKDKFHLDFICSEGEKIAFWDEFEKCQKIIYNIMKSP